MIWKQKKAAGPKTLYLHIGHYKTGTSALQRFLEDNQWPLARAGLDYLAYGRNMSKHSRFAFSLLKEAGVRHLMHGYDNPKSAEQLWTEMLAAAAASRQPNCLISTEEFMRIGAHPKAAEGLARVAALRGDIEIRVIAYLRAPDDHLRSWYNQLVKMRLSVPDFTTAVAEVMEPVHYDYDLALRPWVQVFGPEAVLIRSYDAASRTGTGLFTDFLSVFDIDLEGGSFVLPEKDPNPRLDDRTLPLVRMMQNANMAQATVDWAQKRAVAYLAREAKLCRPVSDQGPDQDFDTVVARSRTGLVALEALPGNQLDVAALQTRLPQPEDPSLRASQQMLGFAFSELKAVRQQLADTKAQLTQRIEALETKDRRR